VRCYLCHLPVVTALSTAYGTLALRERFTTAVRSADAIEALAIEIHTDDGRSGVGMATATPAITGDTVSSMERFVHSVVRPLIVGRTVDEELLVAVTALTPTSPSGTAGVDMALLELVDDPTDARPMVSVVTSITVSAGSAEAMARAALARVEAGFTVVKIKLGVDPPGDLARLTSVFRAIEGRARLWVDANQGWTVDETLRFVDQALAAGVAPEMLEQPVSREAIDDLGAIARHIPVPVVADESARSVADIGRIATTGGVRGVNIKLMKFGGPTGARIAVEAARHHGLSVLVGSMMEHPRSVAAAVRFAASLPAEPVGAVHDLDAAWWMLDATPCRYEFGRVAV
jgi:L-Ala-D/L-Glu epimerase